MFFPSRYVPTLISVGSMQWSGVVPACKSWAPRKLWYGCGLPAHVLLMIRIGRTLLV